MNVFALCLAKAQKFPKDTDLIDPMERLGQVCFKCWLNAGPTDQGLRQARGCTSP